MKLLLWLTLVGAFLFFEVAADNLALSQNSLMLSRKLRVAKERCETENRLECADCGNVMLCDYQKNVLAKFPCEADKPFCNGGLCQSNPGPCGAERSNLCPGGAGYYPSPTICGEFNHCDANDAAIRFTCPTGYAYDHPTKLCKFRRVPTDCFQTACAVAANRNRFFAYTPDPQLYVFCSANSVMLLKCPQGRFHNGTSCIASPDTFLCTTSGRFAFPNDTSKYYLCLTNGQNKLQAFEQKCPIGTEFEEANNRCVSAVVDPEIPGGK